MVCRFCGNQVADGTPTCPYCNANLAVEQPVYQQPQQPVYQQPVQTAAPADDGGLGKSALIFGILSLVLCWTGILGLIFAIVGMNKAKAYQQRMGQVAGVAKVGKILSIIGLISSIIMIVYWAIIIIGAGAAALLSNY